MLRRNSHPIRFTRHPAGGDASEEAGCEEKEVACGSGPSGSIATGGLGNPNSSAGACSKGCAYSYPGALRLGGGAIRHQLSVAVAIIEDAPNSVCCGDRRRVSVTQDK